METKSQKLDYMPGTTCRIHSNSMILWTKKMHQQYFTLPNFIPSATWEMDAMNKMFPK